MIEALFRDIDSDWRRTSSSKIRLRIIGSMALMLQSNYERGTKDSDVIETEHVNEATKEQLLALAGHGTRLHERHRIYVDMVAANLPFLPRQPRCHHQGPISESLKYFDIEVLDVVDVVVSKLKRFSPRDIGDIDAMVARNLVPHHVLIERFRDAVDGYGMDSRIEELPQYVRNLHTVERDMLLVSETEIELPSWV